MVATIGPYPKEEEITSLFTYP